MQIKITAFPRTIASFLMMGVIFFTIAGVAIQIGKYVFNFQDEWLNLLFNVDLEMNLPTWFSALMIAFCAIICKIIATGKKQQGDRYTKDWQLLSLVFWFMAIDEIVSIHEIFIIPEVSKALHLPGFLYSAWVIPGTIFVVWFARRYSKFIYHLPPKSRLHFVWAACIYVGGALVMEMIGSAIAQSFTQQSLIYALSTSVEECLEMSGIVMLIYALIYYLGQWAHQLDLQIEILEPAAKNDHVY
jgi:hypothetical protein